MTWNRANFERISTIRGSADRLVTELNRLGVHFVTSGEPERSAPPLSPVELLAGLANQSEARLRLALIPLLLVHPELAATIPEALARLSEREQLTLKLFYTAAVLLQQCHAEQLRALLGRYDPLPDRFATELGIPTIGDCLDRLKHLGERHRALIGLAINWVGTYRHAADRLLRQLSLGLPYFKQENSRYGKFSQLKSERRVLQRNDAENLYRLRDGLRGGPYGNS